jgi:hypothetical protein
MVLWPLLAAWSTSHKTLYMLTVKRELLLMVFFHEPLYMHLYMHHPYTCRLPQGPGVR